MRKNLELIRKYGRRLIGDGMYYMIIDVVVQPDYQKQTPFY